MDTNLTLSWLVQGAGVPLQQVVNLARTDLNDLLEFASIWRNHYGR